MKLNNYLRIVLFLISNFCFAQSPTIEWEKSLGGTGFEWAFSINQTTDGGYIVAGQSNSIDGDVTGNNGNYDYWIVKLSATSSIEWQTSLGGTNAERAFSIIQSTDGGYIVAGSSSSNDQDVTGNHGNSDFWIVKLSSTGSIQWEKSLGGTGNDEAKSIKQCTDGGYIVAGYFNSINGDVTGHHGSIGYDDCWIVKLSETGSIQWQKSLGGTNNDQAACIVQTTDGGYVMAGYTKSNDGDVSEHHVGCCSFQDYWIVKLSETGSIQWQKSLGGTNIDIASEVIQTTDGGYAVVGYSSSNDGDVTPNLYADYWIVKLSEIGNIQWQKSVGGNDIEQPTSIIQTTDGGYIVSGSSFSFDGDVTENNGFADYWIVKLSAIGILQWQKSLGGTSGDASSCTVKSIDGGYVLAGHSFSNDGDVTENHGNDDFWIVKLLPDNLSINSNSEETTLTVFPNPAKEKFTVKVNFFTPSQEIKITDSLGKIIHSQKVEGVFTTIDAGNFQKGIYFLNFLDNGLKITQKIIVK